MYQLKEIVLFPFRIFYDPYAARNMLDKYIKKYDQLPVSILNRIVRTTIKRKFHEKGGLKINLGSGSGWHKDREKLSFINFFFSAIVNLY